MPNGERIMNTEEIKKFFTRDNIKKFWKKVWGTEPEPVDESVFDDPDRYVKFDEAEDEKYWEDKKRFKREKTILKIRRFTIVFLFMFFFVGFIKSANFIIKTNEFLSCAGRDVCIYLGPKRNYPYFMANEIIGLQNGDAFVLTYDSEKYFSEYYSKEQNSFSKINSKRNIDIITHKTKFGETRRYLSSLPDKLIINSQGNVLIIERQAPLEIFDVKNKKFIKTNVNIFNYKSNKYSYDYIIPYNKKYSIIITNTTRPQYIYNPEDGFRTKLTKPEKLYLFNNDDFSLTEMPPFALPLRYYPRPSDIIILTNGKIILPIRYKYKHYDPEEIDYYTNNSKAKTDHIEIYDPVQKKFIAETNKDILEDNILHMVLPNNNVIFLNKNSTYIFFNETNKFLKADEELTKRNQKAVEKLAKLMYEHMGLDIEEIFGVKRARVVQLAPQKFLITCDIGHTFPFGGSYNINTSLYSLVKMNLNKQEKIQYCRNTVFYDYKKNIVKKGPKLLQPHFYAKIEQLDKNKFIIIGGDDGNRLSPNAKPNNRIQFIKVKN